MYSKVKILGQAIHPMLVSFPVVFYTTTFASFCLFQYTANGFWYRVAFLANGLGVISAVVAAIPGFIDLYYGVPKNTDVRQRGLTHAALNISSLILFSINLYMIWGTIDSHVMTNSVYVFLTGVGFGLTVIAGYHGRSLVIRDHMDVDLTPEQKRYEVGRRVTT